MTLSALLRMTGLEPARAQCPLEPESSASASSATSAHLSALNNNNAPDTFCQHFFYKKFKFSFFTEKSAPEQAQPMYRSHRSQNSAQPLSHWYFC